MNMRQTPLVLLLLGAAGCNSIHLQYDFGRAYVDTLRQQSDLTRPSAVAEAYNLYGPEGLLIRVNAEQATTNTETTTQTVDE